MSNNPQCILSRGPTPNLETIPRYDINKNKQFQTKVEKDGVAKNFLTNLLLYSSQLELKLSWAMTTTLSDCVSVRLSQIIFNRGTATLAQFRQD